MEKSAVREKFIKRLYSELQDFKQSVLEQDKQSVYGDAYKIEVFSSLYNILMEKADSISDVVLLSLIEQSTGILEKIYQDWLKKEDSSYQELAEHVDSEFENGCFWSSEAD